MKPIYAHVPTDEERRILETKLKAAEAWQVRRCQAILMSADESLKAGAIATRVGLSDQQVRRVLHAFNQKGVACLKREKPGRKDDQRAFGPVQSTGLGDAARERLREMVHQSPRAFGCESSLWTLRLLAKVSYQEGLSKHEVHFDTVSQTLQELGLNWQRVKHWINSPDEAYARKKSVAKSPRPSITTQYVRDWASGTGWRGRQSVTPSSRRGWATQFIRHPVQPPGLGDPVHSSPRPAAGAGRPSSFVPSRADGIVMTG